VITVREAAAAEMPAVRTLIEEYCRWIGLEVVFQEVAAELETLPGAYQPPDGALLVGLIDDQVQGVVALRRFSADNCEMKRLYVRPSGRGSGLARALVTTLLTTAVTRGYREVYLDTLPMMSGAQRLYESLGFRDVPPYYDTALPQARFMAKVLAPAL